MNLREAIAAYTNAASARDYYDDRRDAQRADAAAEHLRHCGRVIDAQLAVAEAAIALAEYQAFVAFNPAVEDELWRAFKEAHKAAKDANQQ